MFTLGSPPETKFGYDLNKIATELRPHYKKEGDRYVLRFHVRPTRLDPAGTITIEIWPRTLAKFSWLYLVTGTDGKIAGASWQADAVREEAEVKALKSLRQSYIEDILELVAG